MDNLISVEELAERFKVSPRTVLRLIEKGEIKALRIGRQWRFKKEWIDDWIERNTHHGESSA